MYACKSCGAGLRYDIATKKLVCDYCGSVSDMERFDELNGSKEENYFEATRFRCTQCGAELISADNTGATFCSFCGSSTILEGRLSNEKMPDFIIPFSRTKKDCAEAFKKKINSSFFAPKELADEAHIESFRGIYMPYWVYDVTQDSDFSLNGRTHTVRGNYEITRHYKLSGHIDAEYMGISHDASYEFSDDISEALAPYDIKETTDFHGSYLSGFYADISDVPAELYSKEAIEFANNASIAAIRSEGTFKQYSIDGLSSSDSFFQTKLGKTQYGLFPVWFMSYKSKDRIAYVTINGQTGKVSADIPVDIKKYLITSLVVALPIFIILNMVNNITAPRMLLITIFISLYTLVSSLINAKNIMEKDLGLTDKGLQSHQAKGKKEKPSIFKILMERIFVKKELFGILLTFVSLFISVGTYIINPIHDYVYYGAAMVAIVATCMGVIDIMKDHNILVTRKLPQFNREGGDDSANLN